MDRRTFLAGCTAAMALPAIPAPSKQVVGLDFASPPDATVMRLVEFQNGLMSEVHRVTGIPRYQMGRDTWADQIRAGKSVVVKRDTKEQG